MPVRKAAGSLLLSQSSPGVTLAAGVAAVPTAVFKYVVPRGLGVAFKGVMYLRMKLLDSVGVEMPTVTQCRFTYKTPEDPIWTQPLGSPFLYQPWATLSMPEQENKDHREVLRVNLGCQRIAFIEDETLCLEVYHATGTVDATYTELYIEHVQVTPEELAVILDERRFTFGK